MSHEGDVVERERNRMPGRRRKRAEAQGARGREEKQRPALRRGYVEQRHRQEGCQPIPQRSHPAAAFHPKGSTSPRAQTIACVVSFLGRSGTAASCSKGNKRSCLYIPGHLYPVSHYYHYYLLLSASWRFRHHRRHHYHHHVCCGYHVTCFGSLFLRRRYGHILPLRFACAWNKASQFLRLRDERI